MDDLSFNDEDADNNDDAEELSSIQDNVDDKEVAVTVDNERD